MDRMEHRSHDEHEGPIEIALVGDLTDNEGELTDRLLNVPPNGECTLFIDSPGGSPYCAIALTTIIRLRGIRATGVVTGECSSATLWPFAACTRRIVTPFSVLLFHPMKWQSEEHVGLQEASEWARHFGALERDMDRLLAELLDVDLEFLDRWISAGTLRFRTRVCRCRVGRACETQQHHGNRYVRPSRARTQREGKWRIDRAHGTRSS